MAIAQRQHSERSPLLVPPEADAFPEGDAEAAEEQIDHDVPNQSVGLPRAIAISLSLWALIFLQSSNMSGLTTIQSTIAADLDAFAEASWFASSYLIAVASVAPLAGRISQLFSPRNCMFFSALGFAVGSFVASRARGFLGFIVGRAISGVGAAGLMTISIILVLELTSQKRRGLFIGLVNAGYTTGVALGAVIAGALLPTTGWRALFWAQAPLSLLAGTVIFLSIPKSFLHSHEGPDERSLKEKLASIDYLGALTLSLSIVLFLYGLSSAKINWLSIGMSAILIIIFVLNEIYAASTPIIPISVLSSRGALLTCFAQLGFMASRWTILFYTPVYAIAVRGWSPPSAGSILIPTNLGFAIGTVVAGALHIRRGGSFYIPCITAFILFTASIFVVSQISTAHASSIGYVFLLFVNGLFTGSALNYTLAHILHLTRPSVHFIASSLLSTFRGFAGSFGSAIGSGIFLRLLRGSLERGFEGQELEKEELIRKLLGSPITVQSLQGTDKVVAIEAYEYALKGLFLSSATCAAFTVLIQIGAGWKAPEDKKTVEREGADQ